MESYLTYTINQSSLSFNRSVLFSLRSGNKENKPLLRDREVTDHSEDSSEEDSQFESFASKLRDKWQTTDEMNLKQSLDLDSLIPSECPSESEGESTTIQSFSKVLEEKWLLNSNKLSDGTNITLPLRRYSSNQSDAGDSKGAEDKVLGNKDEKERIPAIVLDKLNIKEIEEKNKCKTTVSSNIKIEKHSKNRNNPTKHEDKKKKADKAESISSGDEQLQNEKTGAKKKVNNSASKQETKSNRSNCLTSSDEEEDKKIDKTRKQTSSKAENVKKAGEKRSKRSVNEKKAKDDDLTEGSSSEEIKKSKDKEDKSNDSTEKKSKRNLKDVEEIDEEKNDKSKVKIKEKTIKENKAEDDLTEGSSNKDSKKSKNEVDKSKDSSTKKSKKNMKDAGESEKEKDDKKEEKSKDRGSLTKKSKKNIKDAEESEEEKHEKSRSEKEKERTSRKSKSKESNSDEGSNKDGKKSKNEVDKSKDSSIKKSKMNIKDAGESEEEKDDKKEEKSKDRDSSTKKSKKNIKDAEESEEEKHEKSRSEKEKERTSRKSKSKESNSDEGSNKDSKKSKNEVDKSKDSSIEKFKMNIKDAGESEEEKDDKKEEKSKDRDSSTKKSKKNIKDAEECEEEKHEKSRSEKKKERTSRKSKSKENNSDEECTKNKKKKLKKSKENDENNKSESDNEKGENVKSKKSSRGLESSNEEKNDIGVENGAESNDEGSASNREENMETSTAEVQEDMENGVHSGKDEMDFKLELQASSTENTNDIAMTQLKEEKLENEDSKKNKSEVQDSEMEEEEKPKEEKTKFVGLDSSSEEEIKVVKKKPSPKKRPSRSQKKPRNVLALSSDDEAEQEEPTLIESSDEENGDKGEKDEDFAVVLDSADSDDSEILPANKRKKKGSSDSDDVSISEDETKKRKKRRRIKLADSSEESGESGDEKADKSLKDGESPAKGGRKNIKKIKKKGDLEQTTIEAAEEEKERRRRIEERQKLFNQVFEIKESAKLEKLVLDFDPETKEEIISVDKGLVAKMKPHQAKGVKFMWDSCFESVKQIKKTKGSGCILAHCMGLGKTFQVISLIHTLLMHEESTKVRTVMVVCPLSTVLNWVNEFGKWLEDIEGGDDIEVFHLTKYNKNPDRARELRRWQHNGGVLVMGYEMFRNLTNETTKKFKAKMKKDFLETLIDPGADLIVCDEGHMLKNEATALSKAMSRVRTLRRIVLTGTPMQNNLKEYHCMVQFVKPNLLGTSKEFLNRFVNPINNGQFVDSTDHDVKLMKRRAHVLHKMLEGLVQRFDYNVLTPFLPPKQEYVISVCLSELQEKLYSYYLENESQKAQGMKGGTRLFMDWQMLGRVWTHPRVLKMSTDKANWLKEKKAMEASDSEGSLRDFIDDDSDKSTTTPEESSDESSDDEKKKKKTVHKSRSTRSTRQTSNVALLESSDEEKAGAEGEEGAAEDKGEWWSSFVEPQHFEDMRQSGKLMLLFAILKECEMIEDKVLVFSQSLFSLDLIEHFLDKIDAATQEDVLDENLDNHQGTWSKGLDYFRLDGSTSSENRNIWCKAFNREDNPRARLFLISTRAGGLGINLTAANRVIIFDASWNPSHDIQSIFRIYRFGQKKPCYVYRFVAYGTMEEKVYERQVAKQSISNRVVDEQQVHRHFSMNDLTELYSFTPASKLDERPTPALPRDPLMAEILSKMKQWIEKYHEHDSLLENVVEEELNEEERKAAWEDYENDKKRGFMPPTGPGPAMNPNAAWNQQIELMRQQLKLRYANKSDDEINSILVYQVSLLMRQQQQQQMQMAAQMQAANNMGNMGYRPQMYGNNMMANNMFAQQRPQMQTTAYLRNIAPKPQAAGQPQSQQFADQVYRMQQQANLARLQMQQMAAQQQAQKKQQQAGKGLQSLLGAHLAGAGGGYPTANTGATGNARAAAELQRMKQNYQASRQTKPGVVITEVTDDKPSGSSES